MDITESKNVPELQQEIDRLNKTVEEQKELALVFLTRSEKTRLDDFKNKHLKRHNKHGYMNSVGRRFIYDITIIDDKRSIIVTCPNCHEGCEITNQA